MPPVGAQPEPFRRLVTKIDHETDPYRRTWRVIDAIEWSVKWETATVLGHLLDRGMIPPALRLSLAAGLGRPSLGTWIGLLRSVLQAATDRPFAAWDEVLTLDDQYGFVQSRNEYAHGAVESDDQAELRYQHLRPVLDALGAAPFLTRVGLLTRTATGFESRGGPMPAASTLARLTGSQTAPWGAFAWIEDTEDLVWLWPLATRLGRSEDDTYGLYFHNALRSGRIESLSYELPAQRRDADLLDPFYERTPLREWSAEANDPYRLLVDELMSGVVGREALVEQLTLTALDGPPVTVVLGAPGQGKSAVMASLVRQLRAREEAVMVVDVFLRRQDRLSEPAQVLRSLIDRIAPVLGRRAPSTRTAEESAEALRMLLQDWGQKVSRPLVLVIDGLDEQPAMLDLLPVTAGEVRLMWSSRPTDPVQTWIMQRRVSTRDVLVIKPLNVSAVRIILRRGVDKFDDRLTENYVREVARLSAGNPLFVAGLSDLLYEEPERIGAENLIPRGVEQLFQSTLDRAAQDADPRLVYETLVLLAIAQDRLEEQQLADLGGNRVFESRSARRALAELVISTEPGSPSTRYGLFHDRLRQWVVDSMSTEATSMQRRLARLAIRPKDLASVHEYLARAGIEHLSLLPDNAERAELCSQLQSALADADTGSAWTSVLDAHALVDLFARTHELLGARIADDRLVARLVELLHGTARETPIDPAGAHDVLAYRPNTAFSDPFYLQLESSLGQDVARDARLRLLVVDRRRRRATDADRARARELLSPIVERPGERVEVVIQPGLQARAMYQWGYLAHLEDDPAAAILAMTRSAELARDGGDLLHEWVARCVAARFGSLQGTLDDKTYLALLGQAEEVFRSERSRSPMALRWVMNTVSQRLELATRRDDETRATELLSVLEDDPWIRSFNQLEELGTSMDRIAIAAGRGADVLASVEQRLQEQLEGYPWREAIAELHLDVARARLAAGDEEGSRTAAQQGLLTPVGCALWIARADLQLLAS